MGDHLFEQNMKQHFITVGLMYMLCFDTETFHGMHGSRYLLSVGK